MKILPSLLALSVLILLMLEAVAFHKATVCRQEAWLKSMELKTRSLLSEVKPYERLWHLNCRIHLLRNGDQVTWQRLPQLKKNHFQLDLRGSL